LAGDTSTFAIELSLSTDLDDHHYDVDERESWGSLTLWVDGVNLTEHLEQGEVLRSAHWYLLPTIEWFVENWDALFHEERLPMSNAGADAASGMTRLLLQPLRMVRSDLDDFQRLESWQAWWARHNLVQSVAGGLFPDVYIRRWGDLVEISVGSSVAVGAPTHFRYANVNSVGRVPVGLAASAVYDVIERAVTELRRRRPGSERLAGLTQALADLSDETGDRYVRRLALLSGADVAEEGALANFQELWTRVSEAFETDGLAEGAREIAVGHRRGGLVLETAPQVALLFGSYNPTVSEADVQVLVRNLHRVLSEGRRTELPDLKLPVLPSLSPGQEGSHIGEVAYQYLVDPESSFVDVRAILTHLGVTYSTDELSDRSTRAVSLVSGGYGVHIVINRNYLRGTSERVLRFTLAHELCHILFDRSRSLRLAIASGPWAPLAVEQRANAFAAAFLMPEELIARSAQRLPEPLWRKGAALRLAAHLRVSVSSLADRLYNLMLISREEADNLTYPGSSQD
jgi:Zn-dependent peptidase ImmA (M78 family)